MTRALAILVVCLIGAGVVWQVAFPSYSYRYRLTVSIEIDGEVHTGSSVIEVIWRGQPEIGDVGPFQPSIRGQAAFVDLGRDGAIVAALETGDVPWNLTVGPWNAEWIAARAFGNMSSAAEIPDLPRLRGRRQLGPDNMPLIIWFSDPANSATARQILPTDIRTMMGKDARLDAFVEITGAPVVVDIEQKLPWYRELERRQMGQVFLRRLGEFQLLYTMFVGG